MGVDPCLFNSLGASNRYRRSSHLHLHCARFCQILDVGCNVERDAIPALNTLTGWEFGDVEKHIPRAAIRPNKSKVCTIPKRDLTLLKFFVSHFMFVFSFLIRWPPDRAIPRRQRQYPRTYRSACPRNRTLGSL